MGDGGGDTEQEDTHHCHVDDEVGTLQVNTERQSTWIPDLPEARLSSKMSMLQAAQSPGDA